MNKVLLTLLVTLAGGYTYTVGAGSVSTTTVKVGLGFNNCIGKMANCNTTVSVNAVGEVADIDRTKNLTKFGKITEDTQKTLEIPTQSGIIKIYSFTPSEGEMAGKELFLALDNVPPVLGSIYSGQKVVKLYAQNQDQKRTEWTTVGNFRWKDALESNSFEVTITPNGTIMATDPVRNEEVTLPLGRRKLAEERSILGKRKLA